MSALVAIDPGYAKTGKGCAVAVFVGGVLVQVYFARPEGIAPAALSVGASVVVWECPQLDARSRVRAPAVVQLAAVGGTLAGMFAGANGAKVEAATPSQWKGSLQKPVHHMRIWEKLTASECGLLGGDATAAAIHRAQVKGGLDRWGRPGVEYYERNFLTHNLLDAVGLGVWRIGR